MIGQVCFYNFLDFEIKNLLQFTKTKKMSKKFVKTKWAWAI